MLVAVVTVLAVAFALDAAVSAWGLVSVLSESCGQDVAWLVALCAAGVASLTAAVALAVVAQWWLTGRPPRRHETWRRGLVVVSAGCAAVAALAYLILPHGSC